jgi:hypothetical protein
LSGYNPAAKAWKLKFHFLVARQATQVVGDSSNCSGVPRVEVHEER